MDRPIIPVRWVGYIDTLHGGPYIADGRGYWPPFSPSIYGLGVCGASRSRNTIITSAGDRMLGLGKITKKVFGTPNDRKIKASPPSDRKGQRAGA